MRNAGGFAPQTNAGFARKKWWRNEMWKRIKIRRGARIHAPLWAYGIALGDTTHSFPPPAFIRRRAKKANANFNLRFPISLLIWLGEQHFALLCLYMFWHFRALNFRM